MLYGILRGIMVIIPIIGTPGSRFTGIIITDTIRTGTIIITAITVLVTTTGMTTMILIITAAEGLILPM